MRVFDNTTIDPNQIVSTDDLERLTGMKKRFWEQRRVTGDTPPFIRISARAIRYRFGDVSQWLDDRKRNSTSDKGGNRNV